LTELRANGILEPVPWRFRGQRIGGAAPRFQKTDATTAAIACSEPIVVAGEALVDFRLESDGAAGSRLGSGPVKVDSEWFFASADSHPNAIGALD
jgi:hypothetical protein